MTLLRSLVLTLVLSTLGAAIGAWGGAQYVKRHMQGSTSLHELVHEKLHLTEDQQRKIGELERGHTARRQVLETEMRAANTVLAQDFQETHAYTPKVQAAIDRSHAAMGGLQKEAIVHVLAMRAVLTPAQATRFDETVVQSLTKETQ